MRSSTIAKSASRGAKPGGSASFKGLCGSPPEQREFFLSHFAAMTRPCWLRRARHRHAIEQASRRWRGAAARLLNFRTAHELVGVLLGLVLHVRGLRHGEQVRWFEVHVAAADPDAVSALSVSKDIAVPLLPFRSARLVPVISTRLPTNGSDIVLLEQCW